MVRGEAGSGKTTFALEVLRVFKGRGAYVTTRVRKEELFEMYPWLGDILSPEWIIDATEVHPEGEVDLSAPDVYYQLPKSFRRAYDVVHEMEAPAIIVFDSRDALVDHFEAIRKPFEASTWGRRELETHLLRLVHV